MVYFFGEMWFDLYSLWCFGYGQNAQNVDLFMKSYANMGDREKKISRNFNRMTSNGCNQSERFCVFVCIKITGSWRTYRFSSLSYIRIDCRQSYDFSQQQRLFLFITNLRRVSFFFIFSNEKQNFFRFIFRSKCKKIKMKTNWCPKNLCVIPITLFLFSVSLFIPPPKRWAHLYHSFVSSFSCHQRLRFMHQIKCILFKYLILLITLLAFQNKNSLPIERFQDKRPFDGRIRMEFLPFTTHDYSHWQSTYNSNRHNVIIYYMFPLQMTTNTLECVDRHVLTNALR